MKKESYKNMFFKKTKQLFKIKNKHHIKNIVLFSNYINLKTVYKYTIIHKQLNSHTKFASIYPICYFYKLYIFSN